MLIGEKEGEKNCHYLGRLLRTTTHSKGAREMHPIERMNEYVGEEEEEIGWNALHGSEQIAEGAQWRWSPLIYTWQ